MVSRLPASLFSRSHIETEGRYVSFCDWGCELAAKRCVESLDGHGHVYGTGEQIQIQGYALVRGRVRVDQLQHGM